MHEVNQAYNASPLRNERTRDFRKRMTVILASLALGSLFTAGVGINARRSQAAGNTPQAADCNSNYDYIAVQPQSSQGIDGIRATITAESLPPPGDVVGAHLVSYVNIDDVDSAGSTTKWLQVGEVEKNYQTNRAYVEFDRPGGSGPVQYFFNSGPLSNITTGQPLAVQVSQNHINPNDWDVEIDGQRSPYAPEVYLPNSSRVNPSVEIESWISPTDPACYNFSYKITGVEIENHSSGWQPLRNPNLNPGPGLMMYSFGDSADFIGGTYNPTALNPPKGKDIYKITS